MKTLATKQREALHRQAERDARTPEQQLQILNTRPGESKRERARLSKTKETQHA